MSNHFRSSSTVAVSAFALAVALCTPYGARAADDPASGIAAPAAPAQVAAEPQSPAAVETITARFLADGRSSIVATPPMTVGAFLAQRGIHVGDEDYLSASPGSDLADGMTLIYRTVKTITILDGKRHTVVHSTAPTVADVIADAGLRVRSTDRVSPRLADAPRTDDVIRIDRRQIWTVRHRRIIRLRESIRTTRELALGTERTIDPGRAGLAETTTRIMRSEDGRTERVTLATRILRVPHARVIERGIAQYASLASAASTGFSSAIRFARSAIRMIATAYTAQCYGCSGYTALGTRAGFGVIAVDPNVIPLGTRLFIPGYGRAVAGDTGGAIHGRRVDLGMSTLAQAMQYGRRPITVYILR